MAVVSGDPGKAGPFVVRLKMPAGYKIAPHWLAIHLLHLRSVEILCLSHGLIGGEQPLDLVAQGGMGGWVSLDPSLHLLASASAASCCLSSSVAGPGVEKLRDSCGQSRIARL